MRTEVLTTNLFDLVGFTGGTPAPQSTHLKSLVVGYWLLVIGYWLLVIGYWLLVIGYWLLVIGCAFKLYL